VLIVLRVCVEFVRCVGTVLNVEVSVKCVDC